MTTLAPSGRTRIAYEVTGEGPDLLLVHAGVNGRRGRRHVFERLFARWPAGDDHCWTRRDGSAAPAAGYAW